MEVLDVKKPSFFHLSITADQSGQKLMSFLEKRLKLPSSLIHRWVRTGQIRVNGQRSKPFVRIHEKDIIRLPPFAFNLSQQNNALENETVPNDPAENYLDIVEIWKNIIVINKPSGISVHPGSKNDDSINSRLQYLYKNKDFIPVVAHRLDKSTSGLILAANNWQTLQEIHEDIKNRIIQKEYLAWVHGLWKFPETLCLRNFLRKERHNNSEKIYVYNTIKDGAKEAESLICCLKAEANRSLLQIKLITGRKHQIRAQLAAMNYPVIGDGKYGSDNETPLYLHSFRIILADKHEAIKLPDWHGEFSVTTVPPILEKTLAMKIFPINE